jgi:energy-coupling factor transport system ATP-binding protein
MAGPLRAFVAWMVWVGGSMALPAFPVVAVMAGLALSALGLWRRSRRRLKAVAIFMIPLALGFALVHGGVIGFLTGSPAAPSPERVRWAAGLWLRILSVVSSGQLWLEYVPSPVLITSLFASSLPAGAGFLLASPLLLGEQIRARLEQIREAQLARGVPVSGSFPERASALTALLFSLVLGLLNDIPARVAALDMKAFGLFRRRTSLKRADSGPRGDIERTALARKPQLAERSQLAGKLRLAETAIRLEGVRFIPPTATGALLEVPELRLPSGERLLVTGDSGSGKSTLASLLSGGVPEHRSGTVTGKALVLEEPIASRNTLAWSPDVQFVQQNPQLSLSGCAFTVYDEVAFGPENLAMPPDEIRARVDGAIAAAGISHLKDRDPSRLSGGEAQKLALASALAMEPRLLVLDEAFTRVHPSDVPVLAGRLAAWSEERRSSVVFLEKKREPFAPWCGAFAHLADGRLLPGTPSAPLRASGAAFRRESFPLAGPSEGSLLRIDDVSFRWKGQEHPLLRSIGKELARGERVALVGPNGAGKSTLMRLCAGLLAPEGGAVLLNGRSVTSMNPKERAPKIGFLFQDAERQIFHSTVEAEVLFSLRNAPLSGEEKMERLEKALDAAGLAGKEKKHPLDLNAAERRMVAAASLSVAEPELLLLDEPTRDFDARRQELFEAWLAERTGAVLAVSHDFDFVSRCFPRVWLLDEGEIRADDAPETVLRGSATFEE